MISGKMKKLSCNNLSFQLNEYVYTRSCSHFIMYIKNTRTSDHYTYILNPFQNFLNVQIHFVFTEKCSTIDKSKTLWEKNSQDKNSQVI